VKSDCTGSLKGTVGSKDSFSFVIVGGGAKILAVDLTPGQTVTVDLKQQ